MAIPAISPISVKGMTFGASKKVDRDGYENPINRKTERNLAILSSTGVSSLVGVTIGGLASCITKGWKLPTAAGAIAAVGTFILMLPSKLYNTKVNAFTREKEMGVYSRQKEAQANIYNDVNKEIKDEDVSLDEKINHYTTLKMADNGSGVMIKGA